MVRLAMPMKQLNYRVILQEKFTLNANLRTHRTVLCYLDTKFDRKLLSSKEALHGFDSK